MDLLTLCLDELHISILALRCRQSGEVHVIRYMPFVADRSNSC